MSFPPPIGGTPYQTGGFDLIRSRDCALLKWDLVVPVRVSDDMLESGWPGGQGVMWVSHPSDEFAVTYSNGQYGGYLLWGSDESADQFLGATKNSITYGYTMMGMGNAILTTSTYEQYTLASRMSGPLVDLTYTSSQNLYFSSRGYWTNEDESSLLSLPQGPARIAGHVCQLPSPNNQWFLGVQTTI